MPTPRPRVVYVAADPEPSAGRTLGIALSLVATVCMLITGVLLMVSLARATTPKPPARETHANGPSPTAWGSGIHRANVQSLGFSDPPKGTTVKDQYFGDVNDYRKYALLMQLGGEGTLRTSVCWMLTAADGRTDGSALAYLNQPHEFRQLAPRLYDLLHQAVMIDKDRRIARFELGGLLAEAVYHSPYLPTIGRADSHISATPR